MIYCDTFHNWQGFHEVWMSDLDSICMQFYVRETIWCRQISLFLLHSHKCPLGEMHQQSPSGTRPGFTQLSVLIRETSCFLLPEAALSPLRGLLSCREDPRRRCRQWSPGAHTQSEEDAILANHFSWQSTSQPSLQEAANHLGSTGRPAHREAGCTDIWGLIAWGCLPASHP